MKLSTSALKSVRKLFYIAIIELREIKRFYQTSSTALHSPLLIFILQLDFELGKLKVNIQKQV